MNPNRQTDQKLFSILVWIFPVFFLLILFIASYSNVAEEHSEKPIALNPVRNMELEGDARIVAQAYIVKDINTGNVLFQKNASLALPLASITKIMTALVAKNIATPLTRVPVTASAHDPREKADLYVGESFSFSKMLDYTLVASSNDGAAAIAQAVQNISRETSFVDKMNTFARDIGMTNSRFLNPTGLDENPGQAGAFGSAEDVALLMEYTLKNFPETFEATKEISFKTSSNIGLMHHATNTNEIVSELPNVLASKTGFTDIAGGNLAVIIDPALNRPVVIVVLGSTQEGRFDDVKNLANSVSKYFSLVE